MLRARLGQGRRMVHTLVGLAFLQASSTVWHYMIASQFAFATRLAGLQLAVAAIGHVLMLFYVRRPKTSREQVSSLS